MKNICPTRAIELSRQQLSQVVVINLHISCGSFACARTHEIMLKHFFFHFKTQLNQPIIAFDQLPLWNSYIISRIFDMLRFGLVISSLLIFAAIVGYNNMRNCFFETFLRVKDRNSIEKWFKHCGRIHILSSGT